MPHLLRGETMADEWTAEGALERMVHLSFGEAESSPYCWQITTDLAVHTWDLAMGIGAPQPIENDIAEEPIRFARPIIEASPKPDILSHFLLWCMESRLTRRLALPSPRPGKPPRRPSPHCCWTTQPTARTCEPRPTQVPSGFSRPPREPAAGS
ncbi:hypothetical protein [Amycolatopsis pithecellobii]|uniref:hypothetical protein n=1 Tax=Amycolatopsis pithecellobii TaxID=664692 RepID=UPI001AA060B9|nr:hypothetical protein [Amycolatopsis pithecellobii]